MKNSELLNNYIRLNNSFDKKVTFHLGADSGFFSEFNNMVFAILYSLNKSIKFNLYSKKGNFALAEGWNDFFMPFCDQSTLFLHHRYNRRSYQMKNAKSFPPLFLKLLSGNQYLTQDIWDYFRSEEFYKTKFTIPDLNLNNASLLEASQKIISMIWCYNAPARKKIDSYKKTIEIPEDFISIHIRSGDKNLETSTYNIHSYMMRAKKESINNNAFVLTDDYSVIENLQKHYKDWCFFTLCSPSERGYIHSEFTEKDKNEKFQQHLKLFASLDICAESHKFIGTYSSNPGMFMGMRIGEKNCACIDSDKWLLW